MLTVVPDVWTKWQNKSHKLTTTRVISFLLYNGKQIIKIFFAPTESSFIPVGEASPSPWLHPWVMLTPSPQVWSYVSLFYCSSSSYSVSTDISFCHLAITDYCSFYEDIELLPTELQGDIVYKRWKIVLEYVWILSTTYKKKEAYPHLFPVPYPPSVARGPWPLSVAHGLMTVNYQTKAHHYYCSHDSLL